MKLLAIAALFALQPQPAAAQAAPAEAVSAAPAEALIDRFIAVLPDREEIDKAGGEIDPIELARLATLNPGKEAQVRKVLQANLACTGPAASSASLRMLRTVARNLGDDRLRKLIGFYEGPDYAAFGALARRMAGKAIPSAADGAAMAKLMGAYPLQAFQEQMGRAEEIMTADAPFMEAAWNCAAEQEKALEAAGLKSN
ncbi:MAG TPA: hypothetical protein VE891_00935 [Allosphingosinicella sp.]|nr:hypothetical protein [Allosphingosinicella sp.]